MDERTKRLLDILSPIPPGKLRHPMLRGNDIHVLRFSITDWLEHLDEFTGLLSPDELKRATGYRFEKHTNAFLIRRGLLRKLIASYLSVEARSVKITLGEHKKPLVSNLQFNLSYSHEAILFAFSKTVPLGVDVEFPKTTSNIDSTAKLVFSPRELSEFRMLDGIQRKVAFYRTWTRKEALVKAMGVGLTQLMTELDVSLEEEAKLAKCAALGDVNRWSLRDLPFSDGYYGCIAYPNRNHDLRLLGSGDCEF